MNFDCFTLLQSASRQMVNGRCTWHTYVVTIIHGKTTLFFFQHVIPRFLRKYKVLAIMFGLFTLYVHGEHDLFGRENGFIFHFIRVFNIFFHFMLFISRQIYYVLHTMTLISYKLHCGVKKI